MFRRNATTVATLRSSTWWNAIALGVAYYLGALVGTAFTPRPQPISPVWPPNAIVLGALALAPARAWPWLIAATLPAHFGIELSTGTPWPMAACWFVGNSVEALLGATALRRLLLYPVRLDTFRRIIVFVAFGALLPVFVSSFLDVWFVVLNRFGTGGFWELWRVRFMSNALAIFAVVPAMIAWRNNWRAALAAVTRVRGVEAAVLAAAILAVGGVVLLGPVSRVFTPPDALCLLLPLLLWSAVRFGPAGASASLLAFSIMAVWGLREGEGPFLVGTTRDSVLALQLFLILTYVPVLALAAVVRERIAAEEDARQSHEQLSLTLAAARVGTWSWEIAADRVIYDDTTGAMFMIPVPSGAARREDFAPLTSPEDQATARSALLASIESGDTFEAERRIIQPDRSVRWVTCRAKVVRDAAGKAVRMIGVAADMTEAKVAEAALRASEERFAKAFRASPNAILIARQADNRVVEVNERWNSLFGYARSDAVGRTIDDLGVVGPDGESDRFRALMASSRIVREAEVDMRCRRGEILRVVVAADSVEMNGEACLIMLFRDITERRRAAHEVAALRQQLAHLGRVAVLGELSGALAHELNQPLTAIMANARAAQRMLRHDAGSGVLDMAELRAILDDIVADDRRAGAVIHRMRALIRRGKAEPRDVIANDVVTEVLELAHSDLILREVTVATRLAPSLPPVSADRVQLQQVVLNLIVNACDAMAHNPPSERSLTISTSGDASAVRLSVSDRGSGITTDSLEAVFEPFFTSKPHGLGLGLSICRSIVDAHGGRMWAVNNVGRGATFHVLLPVTTGATTVMPAVVTRSNGAVTVGGGGLALDLPETAPSRKIS